VWMTQLTSLKEKMTSFGPVPGQRPPTSLLGSLPWPVLDLGLRVLPLQPMSDHNLISNSLFNEGGNNIGRTVKRKAETSENFS